METNRLRYFCTIAETGSLTKASEILGISHSGLSKALAVLQDEVKLQLFQAQGRGLEITEQGRWFYQKAQAILKVTDEISQGIERPTTIVRIGLSEVLALGCAVELTREIPEPLVLLEADTGELETKILTGEIDFGLAFIPSPKPELEYLEIVQLKMNSYASGGLLAKKNVTAIPFIVPATHFLSNPLGFKTRDGWPQEVPRNIYFSVSSFGVALELVKAGEGACYMPDFIGEKYQLKKIKEHKAAESKRKVFLVKAKARTESAAMKKAAKVVRKLL